MTFTINNHKWQLEIKDGEELLNEYHKRHPDAYACFGLTFYGEHKIWIAKELFDGYKEVTIYRIDTQTFELLEVE